MGPWVVPRSSSQVVPHHASCGCGRGGSLSPHHLDHACGFLSEYAPAPLRHLYHISLLRRARRAPPSTRRRRRCTCRRWPTSSEGGPGRARDESGIRDECEWPVSSGPGPQWWAWHSAASAWCCFSLPVGVAVSSRRRGYAVGGTRRLE